MIREMCRITKDNGKIIFGFLDEKLGVIEKSGEDIKKLARYTKENWKWPLPRKLKKYLNKIENSIEVPTEKIFENFGLKVEEKKPLFKDGCEYHTIKTGKTNGEEIS